MAADSARRASPAATNASTTASRASRRTPTACTVGELAAERRNLFTGGFTTPVLALSAERLEHNLAPHGDLRRAARPRLRPARQDLHGAAALRAPARRTAPGASPLAVPHQVRVATAPSASSGSSSPTSSSTPAALRWLAAELDADPDFRFICYVDSVRGVELMDAALRGGRRRAPVDVVVELGAGEGARTGVRTEAECAAVADAVAAHRHPAAGRRRRATRARCRSADRERVARLAAPADRAGRRLRQGGPLRRRLDEIVVSAGGSAWFDAVADVFAEIPELSRPVLKLLRSGAYVSHDDGHYRQLTPFNRVPEEGALQPAFRLWAQVVSRPSPEQAFVNAGKRDAAYDLDLPERPGGPRRADGDDAPGHRHHGHRPVRPARAGCARTPRPTWRSATGWAWACPTRARSSTSGS